jgi:hypothetical protein
VLAQHVHLQLQLATKIILTNDTPQQNDAHLNFMDLMFYPYIDKIYVSIHLSVYPASLIKLQAFA